MECCFGSSGHICDLCKKNFHCGGSGGGTGEIWTDFGVCACYSCWKYAPEPGFCWSCKELFLSRNTLFKHLRENTDHQIDRPEYCSYPECNSSFTHTHKNGEVYAFYNNCDIYEHYADHKDSFSS